MANEKNCRVCGKKYQYCPSCNPKEPAYKSMFCTEQCEAIWNVLTMHGTRKIDEEKAFELLAKCDIPSCFTPDIQRHIDKIMGALIEKESNIIE